MRAGFSTVANGYDGWRWIAEQERRISFPVPAWTDHENEASEREQARSRTEEIPKLFPTRDRQETGNADNIAARPKSARKRSAPLAATPAALSTFSLRQKID